MKQTLIYMGVFYALVFGLLWLLDDRPRFRGPSTGESCGDFARRLERETKRIPRSPTASERADLDDCVRATGGR